MPNKAIHQLAFSDTRQSDDRLYVVRQGVDYQIPASAMAPALLQQTTFIESADVLTLNDTPVQVVDPVGTGLIAYPVRAVIQFSDGTTDYATNTELVIGASASVDDTNYQLAGNIADASEALFMASGGVPLTGDGDGLSAYVRTGNPTAGNYDLTVTVYYYLLSI
jgi:hypothetical protein